MKYFPIFLSVVFVVRNQSGAIAQILLEAASVIAEHVSDYEIIVVDNASNDDSISVFKRLADEGGQPNLQVYALTKEVDADTASWVGLENALGDFVAVLDPFIDDIKFLPEMLDEAAAGADVVFANNDQEPAQNFAYRAAKLVFNGLYKWLNGINLTKEAPHYRILSKNVIGFILQHRQPATTYRHLPATGGFSRVNLKYSARPRSVSPRRLGKSVDLGMRLLVSTTQVPMRLVTSLSLFGATANILYCMYVVFIAFWKVDIAPGWISLSLQQSGMFFLLSMVLFVLGEYILHMASLSNEGPLYHVGQEFTSARMTRRERLNIEAAEENPSISTHTPTEGGG
ncbi:glycosyltransferase [Dyella ginsengisoli]|uniref:Glycosyltransferase n=2 Tax=Dyella ginsengisoli TaxID=363848 RepID=A0ABW8JSN0_9GAMM